MDFDKLPQLLKKQLLINNFENIDIQKSEHFVFILFEINGKTHAISLLNGDEIEVKLVSNIVLDESNNITFEEKMVTQFRRPNGDICLDVMKNVNRVF